MLNRSQATLFRQWTLGDPEGLDPLPPGLAQAPHATTGPTPNLIRIATLIAMDATTPAYQREVNAALAAGATVEDIISVLVVVTGIVGSVHSMAAAPRLAIALGYDVNDDLELLSPPDEH